MNSYLQPLKNGFGFRLVPKNNLQQVCPAPEAKIISSPSPSKNKVMSKTKSGRVTKTGRGRKSGQSLKFHNFVANDCSNRTSHGQDGERSTHCLREEHGTKQITVSHWKSVSEDVPPAVEEKKITIRTPQVETKPSKTVKNPVPTDLQKQSILESLLAKRFLSEMRQLDLKQQSQSIQKAIQTRISLKNKRKPLVVRRFLTSTHSSGMLNT